MSAEPPVRRGRRTWPQRLLILVNVLVAMAFLATAGGLAYGYTKFGRLPRVELGAVLTDQDVEAEAQNVLLVGVDSAEGLDPDDPRRATREENGALRSDTMMILRVDPASSRAALLSIPRDLYVPIANTRRSGRINEAISAEKGAERLIATIQESLGIPINHYVQVDFFGFTRLVNEVGGVPIYFPHPARDRRTGLNIEEAGCANLDGNDALAFVRSRAYEERIDGRWRVDGSGDLGRVKRQQAFIVRALRRAITRGVRNPVTLDELIDVGLDSVTVDDTLTAEEIVTLGRRFRTFEPEALDLYELPIVDDFVAGAPVLRLIDRQADPILDIFRGGSDPDDVSAVRVRVLNGSGRAGEAASTSDALVEVGFRTAGIGDARQLGRDRSVIRYESGAKPKAELLARWLVEEPQLEVADDVTGDVELVTGTAFEGIRVTPKEAPARTTTTLPRITTTTEDGGSSRTTILGTVPANPQAEPCA